MWGKLLKVAAVAAIAVAALAAPANAGGFAAQENAGTAPGYEDVVLISTPPPVGTAGTCSVWGTVCGHVYNDDDRNGFFITDNWGAYGNPSTWTWLNPGRNSDNSGVKDADGFRVSSGCSATIAFVQNLGPGWYKVYDGQYIHITDYRC